MGYKDTFIPFDYLSIEEKSKVLQTYEEKGLSYKKITKNIKGFDLSRKREIREKLKSSDEYNTLIEKISNNYSIKQNQHIVVEILTEAITLIEKIDIRSLLHLQVQPSKNFNCLFIENNIASVARDAKGIWRYFTRNQEETVRHSLGIVDLVELIFDLNYFLSVEMLCELSNIEVLELRWKKYRQEIYKKNILIISEPESSLLRDYPILLKFVKRHLYLLREIYLHGNSVLSSETSSLNNMDIFFSSSRYLEKKLKSKGIERSHTTLNKLINLFVVLGLLVKIDIENVPDKMKNDATLFQIKKAREVVKGHTDSKKNCHPISFYQIPEITNEILKIAEQRVISLKKNSIKATGIKISSVELMNAIGEDEYSKLFHKRISFIKAIELAKNEKRRNQSLFANNRT